MATEGIAVSRDVPSRLTVSIHWIVACLGYDYDIEVETKWPTSHSENFKYIFFLEKVWISVKI